MNVTMTQQIVCKLGTILCTYTLYLPSLHQAINQLEDSPGPADISGALSLLHEEVFTPESGDRSDVRNAVTFIIDHVCNKGQKRIVEEAELCFLAGICTYKHIFI